MISIIIDSHILRWTQVSLCDGRGGETEVLWLEWQIPAHLPQRCLWRWSQTLITLSPFGSFFLTFLWHLLYKEKKSVRWSVDWLYIFKEQILYYIYSMLNNERLYLLTFLQMFILTLYFFNEDSKHSRKYCLWKYGVLSCNHY